MDKTHEEMMRHMKYDRCDSFLDTTTNQMLLDLLADYDSGQLNEIIIGLEKMLYTNVYNNPKYTSAQMRQIRVGLEEDVDVSIYADPKYTAMQMEQIRVGLECEIDVSVYADPKYDWKEMDVIRYCLKHRLDLGEIGNTLICAKNRKAND